MGNRITCWCGDYIESDDQEERATFMRFHEVICPEVEADR